MNEFNNRVEAQRQVLKLANAKPWKTEELFGLSSKAIERWVNVNHIDPDSRVVQLIKTAGAKLFFLANKSQEQISEEYKLASREVSEICRTLELEIS
jgi:hypothetical protein